VSTSGHGLSLLVLTTLSGYTCIHSYTDAEVAYAKLLYAITHCRAIDRDFRVRDLNDYAGAGSLPRASPPGGGR